MKIKDRDWKKIQENLKRLLGAKVQTMNWDQFLARIRLSTRLRFLPIKIDPKDCKGCGKCCRKYDVVEIDRLVDVRVPECMTTDDPDPLANALLFGAMRRRANGACVALDEATGKCTIYEDRPRTCRRYYCVDEVKYKSVRILKAHEIPESLRRALETKRSQ